jgi:lactate dehydrogenase-like 2-hydroxyacid dehydrogenase
MDRILQLASISSSLDAQLKARFDVIPLWEQGDPDGYLQAHADQFEVLVTNASAGANAQLQSKFPNLKLIVTRSVGYDQIDVDFARSKGIAVCNTPKVLNACVADCAMALMLDVVRQVSKADRFVRQGAWVRGAFPLTTSVSGKRLGILGLGQIGLEIKKRAEGFDLEIGYHNRHQREGEAAKYFNDPVALAEWADFLMVVVATSPSEPPLINQAALNALGKDGYLINVARGFIVDEPLLVRYLKEGRIAGAGLDVFAHEPNVPTELFELDTVVLSPHVASGTHETRAKMGQLVLDNIAAYLEGKPLITPIP